MTPDTLEALGAKHGPVVIAALHLPDLSVRRELSMGFLEDYALRNAAVFAEAGVPALMLQDQTRQVGPASPATVAVTAALGRLIRREFPAMALGIIVQAHDAVAPLAIAHAAGASFVRLKVFVGAAMTAEGPRNGLAVEARSYRHELRRDDVAILADVFDRTSRPLLDVPPAEAVLMAEKLGADGLILTGGSFADSLDRVRAARAAGARRPVLIGGSVTEANLAEALAVAEGAVVSTSLMRPGASPEDVLQWDADRTRRFMDAVRALPPRRAA
ncbi:BtpA/SgcQ family protein [Roseomonas sp. BN140053]|uniref:BtpA/SgcQ family protein n=1 Tax=Roseomonas sp. BN140053 TaxID=3391898 RepID=UPI0039E98E61